MFPLNGYFVILSFCHLYCFVFLLEALPLNVFSYTSAADWFDGLTRRDCLQIFNCELTLLLGHQPDMEILDPLHGHQCNADGQNGSANMTSTGWTDRSYLGQSVQMVSKFCFFKQSLP